MSKKQYFGLIAMILFIIGSLFYWYEWRPTKIKEKCYAEAEFDWKTLTAKNETEKQTSLDNYFNNCLMRFGLK